MKRTVTITFVIAILAFFLMAQALNANTDIAEGIVTRYEIEIIGPELPLEDPYQWYFEPIQFEVVEVPAYGVTLNLEVLNPENGQWIFCGYSNTNSGGYYYFGFSNVTEPIFYDLLQYCGEVTLRITNPSGSVVYTPEFRWSMQYPIYVWDFCIGF
ncbi:MAG TPA: hypothetical protein ENL20_09120 [Candidatus Cloacimonetes bacterium]|nr:hypothetical protein [Candidatus Cloacimonadota bacterium]